MPGPDMVFTEREVADADRAAGRRSHGPAPSGPDMVFTEAEVAAASRPPALTVEERDRSRAPRGVSAERAAALASAGDSRRSEVIGALGAVNDTAAAVGNYRDATPGQLTPGMSRTLGGISTAAGLAQMYGAYRSGTRAGATEAERRQAAYSMGVGSTGAAGGVLTMAGASTGAGVLGVVGGGLEVAQGIDNIRHGDIAAEGAGYQQVLHGGLAAGAGAASLAGATAAAPVLAAGAAGVSIGTTLQQRADAVSLESGRYTERRASGRGLDARMEDHNISASDAAAIAGVEDGRAWTELTGSENVGLVMGGLSTAGRSIYNTFTNLW